MSLYPTRQPITHAGIAAYLASLPAAPRTARVRLRVTQITEAARAELVARMADDMRRHGEGMTRADLKLCGWSDADLEAYAEAAAAKARAAARLD